MTTVMPVEVVVASTPTPHRTGRRTALFVAAMSLALSLWEMAHAGVLSSYDSGVYYDASLRLLSGILPYRDFTFVQPPGITEIFAPAAVVGHLIGVKTGFWVARVMSALANAANAALVAWLLRHRGRLAMLIAGLSLAITPIASTVSTSAKLEPYFMLFVLLGLVRLLHDDQTAVTTRDLVAAGIFFGVAIDVKGWALLLVLVAIAVIGPRVGRSIWRLIAAMGLTLVIVMGPFFWAAPTRMWREVIVDQLSRRVPHVTGVWQRLIDMTGYQGTWLSPNRHSIIFFVGGATMCLVAVVGRRPRKILNVFAVSATAVSAIAILMTQQFFAYYCYLSAPFLAIVIALAVARISQWPLLISVGAIRFVNRLRKGVAIVVIATLAATTGYVYAHQARLSALIPTSEITRLVPAGACVVYDVIYEGVVANRVSSTRSDCPVVIDSYGMWLANGNQMTAPPSHFSYQWLTYFSRAQYVVLSHQESTFVPWSFSLENWFSAHFVELYGQRGVYIYRRIIAH